jgi:hypothetical protein
MEMKQYVSRARFMTGLQSVLVMAALTAFSEIIPYVPPVDPWVSTATSKITATNSPPAITIDCSQWAKKANYTNFPTLNLYRKLAGARGSETYLSGYTYRGTTNGVWFTMQTGSAGWGTPIATFSGADFKTAGYIYTDTNVQAGVHYEYSLDGVMLNAGIRLPLEENRGKVVLLVDNTMQTPLAGEIAQLQADLRGDGWTVITEYVPRMAVDPANTNLTVGAARRAEIDAIRNVIKTHYTNDPANVKAVYLLGKVPQPYLGDTAYDGHSTHTGAWPADIYYAEMDDTAVSVDATTPANIGKTFPIWSDQVVNNTSPPDARNDNVPNDGKLDDVGDYISTNYFARASADVAIGRVDFSGMTWFPASETELLRRYLRRAHDYRMRQGLYANIRREMFWDNSWQEASYEKLGNRWASGTVGLPNMYRGDWFSDNISGDPWLLGNGGGAGGFTSAAHVGDSRDCGSIPAKAIFVSMFGSYFGDWGVSNNFLRATLAGTPESTVLSCDWDVFNQQYTGLGKPLSYGILLSLQEYIIDSGYAVNSLHGDLTLRTTILPPVRNLRVTPGSSTATLAWDAATNLTSESVLQGYHVYRATSAAGPFTRITGVTADAANPAGTPITETTFTDTGLTNGAACTYMVKVIALTAENAGSYMNASIGSPVTVTPGTGPVPPAAPGGLTATALATTNVVLRWTDNATTETGFVIERKAGYDGSWIPAGTVSANATNYADLGSAAIGATMYYRVKATGATADSLWSPEVSVLMLAGEVAFAGDCQTIEITGANVLIPVERRFGSFGAVSVTVTTASPTAATAQPGVHYTAISQTLNWADGETGVKNVTVPVLGSSPWLSRAFQVNLSNPVGGLALGMISQSYIAMENPTTVLPSPWKYRLYTHSSTVDQPNDIMGAKPSQAEGAIGMAHANLPSFTSTAGADGFIYRQMTGNGTVVGRLVEHRSSSTTARSGLLVRSGMNNYRFSSGLKGTSLETLYRGSGNLTSVIPGPTASPPYWFRITRAGDVFTAETSADGSVWNLLSTQTLTNSPATQLWGFNDDPSNGNSFSMVAFDNLTLLKADRPTALDATITGTKQVSLQWADNSTVETGYRIEMRTGSGAWTILGDASSNATGYVVNGLDLGVTRDFRVAPLYADFALHDGYEPVYVQAFPYRKLSALGWAMIYKDGASITDEAPNRAPVSWSVTDSDGQPGINPRVAIDDSIGVLNSWPTGGSSTRALFMFTEDQPLSAALYPREKLLVSVDRKDINSAASPMRFALKIGGQWYVSDAFTIAATSTEYVRHQIDFRTNDPASWSLLNYVPGTTLTRGAATPLPAGDIQTFGIYFDDGFNNSGVHLDTFRVGSWNPVTSASQTLLAGQDPSDFSVTPWSAAAFSGVQGGSYTPSSAVYTLENTGASNLNWSISHSASWLDVSSASGTLAAGSSVAVTVSVNSAASDALPSSGRYTDTLVFSNSLSGVVQNRSVSLDFLSGPPPAPSALSATAVSTSAISLSWTDNAGDEAGFVIERKTGAGYFAPIASAAVNVTNYTDTGLSSGTTYTYRVGATNASGSSAWSAEASATTPETPAPSVSTLVIDPSFTNNYSATTNKVPPAKNNQIAVSGTTGQIATDLGWFGDATLGLMTITSGTLAITQGTWGKTNENCLGQITSGNTALTGNYRLEVGVGTWGGAGGNETSTIRVQLFGNISSAGSTINLSTNSTPITTTWTYIGESLVNLTSASANSTVLGNTFDIDAAGSFDKIGYRVSFEYGATDNWATGDNATEITSLNIASLSAPPPSDPYSSWASDHGLAADSMLDESPAGDGIKNLMKYALGISPTNSGLQGRLEQAQMDLSGTNWFVLRYVRPEPKPADLTYTVQAVESLMSSNWTDCVEVSSTVSNSLRTITVRDPLPISGNTNRFIRLKVTK